MIEDLENQADDLEINENIPAQEEQVEPRSENLRDTLKNALAEQKSKQEAVEEKGEEKGEEKSGRKRDERGKFAKNEEIAQQAEAPQETSPKPINAPQSWSAVAKAKWAELPSDIQAEIARREDDVQKGFTRLDEERNFGKQLKEIISPYLPMINAGGGTPTAAIQDLLNTAYVLRTATPQQKGSLLKQIAEQYGADFSAFSPAEPNPYIDPQLQALEQRQRMLEEQIQREDQQRKHQQWSRINAEIQAFASDSANIHFEAVQDHMAALIKSGLAKDLKDAYEQATYARPDIRSTLLEAQRAEAEAKRLADLKQKSQAARNASVSITGSPGGAVPNKLPPERSLRDELTVNLRAALNA